MTLIVLSVGHLSHQTAIGRIAAASRTRSPRGGIREYLVVHPEGEKKGPVGEQQLHLLLRAGTITGRSLLKKSGIRDWQALARIYELTKVIAD